MEAGRNFAGLRLLTPPGQAYDPVMKKIIMAVFICAGLATWPHAPARAAGSAMDAPAPQRVKAGDKRSKDAILPKLTRQLGQATDPDNARILAGTIRKLWRYSDSPTIRLLMERAGVLISESRPVPALQILDSIVEIAPEYGEAWFQRSVLLLQMDEIGRALHDVGQTLDLNPDHFDALRQLGVILNRLGDRKGALNAYQRARRLYPLLPGIGEAIKALSEPAGRAI